MATISYRAVSPNGLALVTNGEGLRLVAYDDRQPARTTFTAVAQVLGRATIGYGHTAGVTPQDVVSKRSITKAQAIAYLQADLMVAVRSVYAAIGAAAVAKLTQDQYDALVVFTYNCGLGGAPTLVSYLKAGRLSEVPAQMMRFVNDGGVKVQGLVNRRRAEVDLWERATTSSAPARPAALFDAAPSARPPVSVSRTFRAAIVSGCSGVGTATAAAIGALDPYANEGILKTMLVAFVAISTVTAFVAAALRAQDHAAPAA